MIAFAFASHYKEDKKRTTMTLMLFRTIILFPVNNVMWDALVLAS